MAASTPTVSSRQLVSLILNDILQAMTAGLQVASSGKDQSECLLEAKLGYGCNACGRAEGRPLGTESADVLADGAAEQLANCMCAMLCLGCLRWGLLSAGSRPVWFVQT